MFSRALKFTVCHDKLIFTELGFLNLQRITKSVKFNALKNFALMINTLHIHVTHVCLYSPNISLLSPLVLFASKN